MCALASISHGVYDSSLAARYRCLRWLQNPQLECLQGPYGYPPQPPGQNAYAQRPQQGMGAGEGCLAACLGKRHVATLCDVIVSDHTACDPVLSEMRPRLLASMPSAL